MRECGDGVVLKKASNKTKWIWPAIVQNRNECKNFRSSREDIQVKV